MFQLHSLFSSLLRFWTCITNNVPPNKSFKCLPFYTCSCVVLISKNSSICFSMYFTNFSSCSHLCWKCHLAGSLVNFLFIYTKQHGSRADTFQFLSMCVLPLTAAALHFYSAAALVIQSPSQHIRKISVFVRWRSTKQQLSAKQIQRDRKSDTDTTLKHLVNFKIKHSHCVDARSYFT